MGTRRRSPGCAWLLAAASLVASACASAPLAPGTPSPSPFPDASRAPACGPMLVRPAGAAGAVAGGAIVQAALEYLGGPYRYGGGDPARGFDCSGLVAFVFDRRQFALPRTVAEQYLLGSRVGRDDLDAGDLIFFRTTGRGATHVGIALGRTNPGQFVHAPATGGVVRIERYDGPYWRDRIVGSSVAVGVALSRHGFGAPDGAGLRRPDVTGQSNPAAATTRRSSTSLWRRHCRGT